MDAIGEKEIRGSFVNCSKGEAKRLNLPKDLRELPWDQLDYLGWRDPGAPERSYLVSPTADGLVGMTLRFPGQIKRGAMQTTVCSICLTSHEGSGVALFVAPRVGAAGRQGNTVGTYICADLACSLYVRGVRATTRNTGAESLTVDERAERLRRNLAEFIARVQDGIL